MSRTRLQMDERREQLLVLGMELFAGSSYETVSIDEIARRAGMSKGLLYHYFGGKKDFYIATMRFAAGRLLDAIQTDPALSPAERVRAGLTAYLDFVEGRGEAYAALLHGGLGADGDVLAIIEQTRDEIVRQTLTGFGIDDPPPIFHLAIRSWLGAVEHACLQWLAKRHVSRQTLTELLAETLEGHIVAAGRLAG